MVCLRCNGEAFEKRAKAKVVQEYRGVELIIRTPAMSCARCAWMALAEGHRDELLKRIHPETGNAGRHVVSIHYSRMAN